MEVYIDDMLVKSKEVGGNVQDLEERFAILAILSSANLELVQVSFSDT